MIDRINTTSNQGVGIEIIHFRPLFTSRLPTFMLATTELIPSLLVEIALTPFLPSYAKRRARRVCGVRSSLLNGEVWD